MINESILNYSEVLFPPNNIRKGVIKISGRLKVDQVQFTKDKLFFVDNRGDMYMHNLVIGKIENNSHYIKGP